MDYEIKKMTSTGIISFTQKWLRENLGLSENDMIIVQVHEDEDGEKVAMFKKFDPSVVFKKGKEADKNMNNNKHENGTDFSNFEG